MAHAPSKNALHDQLHKTVDLLLLTCQAELTLNDGHREPANRQVPDAGPRDLFEIQHSRPLWPRPGDTPGSRPTLETPG